MRSREERAAASENKEGWERKDTASARMLGHTKASMKPGSIYLLAVCFCVFVRGSESSAVAAFEGSDDHPQKMYSRGNLKYIATRLHPGDELKSCLGELCSGRSMFVLSCVGSVSCATIRCANYLKAGSSTTNDIKVLKQKFEIVSLVGSICGKVYFVSCTRLIVIER